MVKVNRAWCFIPCPEGEIKRTRAAIFETAKNHGIKVTTRWQRANRGRMWVREGVGDTHYDRNPGGKRDWHGRFLPREKEQVG